MEITEFIQQFNSINPEYAHILAKYGDQADTLFPGGKWYPITQLQEYGVSNYIEYLILNTDISVVGVGAIAFRSEFKVVGNNLLKFAQYNDSESVCLDKLSGAVYSVDEEFVNVELLSPSVDLFLQFLLLFRWRELNIIFGEKLPENFSQLITALKRQGFSTSWLEDFLNPPE